MPKRAYIGRCTTTEHDSNGPDIMFMLYGYIVIILFLGGPSGHLLQVIGVFTWQGGLMES